MPNKEKPPFKYSGIQSSSTVSTERECEIFLVLKFRTSEMLLVQKLCEKLESSVLISTTTVNLEKKTIFDTKADQTKITGAAGQAGEDLSGLKTSQYQLKKNKQ